MSWAFASLNASPGARAFYDQQRAKGLEHNDALRRLANRLVGILHGRHRWLSTEQPLAYRRECVPHRSRIPITQRKLWRLAV